MLTAGLECPAYLENFWHFSSTSNFDASGIIYKVIFHTSKINCSAYEKRIKKTANKLNVLMPWREARVYICILFMHILDFKHVYSKT